MSNAIRYDALLVRDLAAELNRLLAGARLEAAYLDRDSLRATLKTRAARRGAPPPPSLLWQLHPDSGHLTAAVELASGGRVQLSGATPIRAVTAPPDERVLSFELDAADAPAGAARRIIIELVTGQWNAIAVGADDRITAVLRERTTKDRSLRAGVTYEPPRAAMRPGAVAPLPLQPWLDELAPVPPGERLRAALRFAYISPLNATAIIGNADVTGGEAALVQAHARYLELVWTAPRAPVLIHRHTAVQPYGTRIAGGTAQPSLLAAFAEAAAASAAAPTPADGTEAALAAVAQRLDALTRRYARLLAEQAGAAAEAEHTRHVADVLMSQLQRVPRGAAVAELEDFDGSTVRVELDPALDAARNAARLYDTARRRQRAAARIPALLRGVATERTRLEELAARIRAGSATAEELAALQRRRAARGHGEAAALPYREYRTSRGTEVRVGRGSRANDELTFHHSTGNDIWLHARDVGGAHVILRWPHADANPAAADIAEAAVLAALYSRARTSATVAVDWTRRKYVRKPRKAPPGLVLPERVQTVFVQPDAAVEERMRAG
ncbi:MAG TPA: NFACT RNA binding domain-containing protein [Longimicrobiales bacterium]|nr:NFACT RNA binding domain-containing protein [Longimicrobiales bacterium]